MASQIPDDDWPGVTYNGLDVFDTIYESEVMAQAEALAREKGNYSVQECYLGYDPQADRFIMGFDSWDLSASLDDEDSSYQEKLARVVYITCPEGSANPKVSGAETIASGSLMYGKGGGYEDLHKKYPKLIDLRLD